MPWELLLLKCLLLNSATVILGLEPLPRVAEPTRDFCTPPGACYRHADSQALVGPRNMGFPELLRFIGKLVFEEPLRWNLVKVLKLAGRTAAPQLRSQGAWESSPRGPSS